MYYFLTRTKAFRVPSKSLDVSVLAWKYTPLSQSQLISKAKLSCNRLRGGTFSCPNHTLSGTLTVTGVLSFITASLKQHLCKPCIYIALQGNVKRKMVVSPKLILHHPSIWQEEIDQRLLFNQACPSDLSQMQPIPLERQGSHHGRRRSCNGTLLWTGKNNQNVSIWKKYGLLRSKQSFGKTLVT